MPLTESEKSARKRKSKKENGLVRLPDYGTEKQRDEIKAYLRGEAEIKLNGVVYENSKNHDG